MSEYFLLKVRKFGSALAEKVIEKLGMVEESYREQLRMALRSEVGGYFPSRHYHQLPVPPVTCPSL